MPSATPPRPIRLRISPAAERAVRSGHPWVYADSIRDQHREGVTGDLAVVFDRQDRFLAIGLYDAESPIRLRILHAGPPVALDEAWWIRHLRGTLARRDGLFGPDTTGHRWIHGESDGWPGLVLDRYDGTLVLKLYSAAWLPRIPELAARLREILNPGRLVLRLSRNCREAGTRAGVTDGADLWPADGAERVPFLENGLTFEAEVLRGQKTGFFLDQRDNRRRLGEMAAGARVLNLFSYTGGFSVYAAHGGARSVTDLDISAHAIEQARRHFRLNRHLPAVAQARHEAIQADAFEWLAGPATPAFDLIILDPPSLARRESERDDALKAYDHLVRGAVRRLLPGGRLLAASCSAHVTAAEFFETVRNAIRRSARGFRELGTTGHPPDHPSGFAEAAYLKALYIESAA
ncbi:MAG: class I SAM-dependent methyltransferase [Verrucomicrobia bacterium]|nr:class I SAM-dependent methyltransferase [Verrucomicrobiota bacterium]